MKLLPNDRGKCSLKRRAAAWQMANVDDLRNLRYNSGVIYATILAQSPERATHGGCVIQP